MVSSVSGSNNQFAVSSAVQGRALPAQTAVSGESTALQQSEAQFANTVDVTARQQAAATNGQVVFNGGAASVVSDDPPQTVAEAFQRLDQDHPNMPADLIAPIHQALSSGGVDNYYVLNSLLNRVDSGDPTQLASARRAIQGLAEGVSANMAVRDPENPDEPSPWEVYQDMRRNPGDMIEVSDGRNFNALARVTGNLQGVEAQLGAAYESGSLRMNAGSYAQLLRALDRVNEATVSDNPTDMDNALRALEAVQGVNDGFMEALVGMITENSSDVGSNFPRPTSTPGPVGNGQPGPLDGGNNSGGPINGDGGNSGGKDDETQTPPTGGK